MENQDAASEERIDAMELLNYTFQTWYVVNRPYVQPSFFEVNCIRRFSLPQPNCIISLVLVRKQR